MKATVLALFVVFAVASGCARSDWIQETLVTVDVTGTWLQAEGELFQLELQQQGQKVRGTVYRPGLPSSGVHQGEVEGTVSGDVFRFRQTTGANALEGEMTVNGDEMTGRVSPVSRRGPVVLRRVK